MNRGKTKILIAGLAVILSSSCSWMVTGRGQVIYHWEKENTGIEKFARDHSECLRKAEGIYGFQQFSNYRDTK